MLGIEPEIIANYVEQGNVRLIFMPVLNHGDPSVFATAAADCLGQQDPALFWTMHGRLFADQQSLWGANRQYYLDLAVSLGGDAVEGVIYPLATGFDPGSSAQPTSDFVRKFRERYGYEPGWVEAQCYDAFMLVCEAVGKNPTAATGSLIREVFDSMDKYEGVAGAIKFDQNGDVVKPVRFKTVMDGKFTALSD